jgi:hypothetical protein
VHEYERLGDYVSWVKLRGQELSVWLCFGACVRYQKCEICAGNTEYIWRIYVDDVGHQGAEAEGCEMALRRGSGG